MSTAPVSPPGDPARPSGAVRIANVAGIPVYLSSMWVMGALLLIAVFASQAPDALANPGRAAAMAAMVVAVLFCSILVHEASHALAARAQGYHVLNITLTFWGGATRYACYQPRPLPSALIALAGPLANFALAGLGWGAGLIAPAGPSSWLAHAVMLVNLTLGIYNILPGLPFDGGQVVAGIAWGLTRNHTSGIQVAAWAGRVVVVLTGICFLYTGLASGSGPFSLIWTVAILATLWQMTAGTMQLVRARRELDRLTTGLVGRPAILLPDTMPQQLALAYAEPRRAYILRDAHRITGVVPEPLTVMSGPLDPIAHVAVPVPAEPFVCDPACPVTDFVIAMQAEQRPAIALRFPSGEGRVLTLSDIVRAAAHEQQGA